MHVLSVVEPTEVNIMARICRTSRLGQPSPKVVWQKVVVGILACGRYGRTRPGKCHDGQTGCFKAGQKGHFMREFPKNKQRGGSLGNKTQYL